VFTSTDPDVAAKKLTPDSPVFDVLVMWGTEPRMSIEPPPDAAPATFDGHPGMIRITVDDHAHPTCVSLVSLDDEGIAGVIVTNSKFLRITPSEIARDLLTAIVDRSR
jgi:hypothetical protein